jgi:uncharacterized membrane protein
MFVPVASRAREAHSRSFAKAVSWRITGSLDTFFLSLIITRSFTLAGSIASVEVITKIVLYYLHERVWGVVSWGRPNPSHSGEVVDSDTARTRLKARETSGVAMLKSASVKSS